MACIQSGHKYALINIKGGTALDLSGGDNRSIIGYPFHKGPNQEWIFEKTGGGQVFYIKSSGSGQFLTSAGELYDGQKVVADDAPFPWCVQDVPGHPNVVKISPESDPKFCVDLENGSSEPGTKVQLWTCWEPGLNQKWRLEAVQ